MPACIARQYKCVLYLTLTKYYIFPSWISVWAITHYQATKPIGRGYLHWVPNVTGEKILITFSSAEDRTSDPPHKNPTLYYAAMESRSASSSTSIARGANLPPIVAGKHSPLLDHSASWGQTWFLAGLLTIITEKVTIKRVMQIHNIRF